MTGVKLRVGCREYDHTRALFEGTTTIDGVDASFETAPIVSDIFERMVRHHAFDVAELGLTFYLRTLDFDDPPFIALPVFPARHFRHSAIYVNTSSRIKSPADLAGKTIGEFAIYGHDAGVWPKGILSDDYGVKPDQCRWIVGGTNWPMTPLDFVPSRHPVDVDVTPTPDGKALDPMLEEGRIDALISAHVPRSLLDGSTKVAPLFADSESVEREYFARTGIFPIMHTVVVRRDFLARHPGVAQAIYRGFCDAKDIALEQYGRGRNDQYMDCMVPWFAALFDKNSRLLPDDWWPYGVDANRHTIDTFLRYFYEQGLSKRRFRCEEIFVPELLDT
ncbi:4,5-dihydroxyphthalate decarboxylase [Mycobacterium sp.]|jgi:4,5-dihydroxyphthalate decarboxylase|uniref:4,5-dihydroxyphthalate decarboxylase n=1 Tax=Mycobacterium sp. TaxID=1785 RepID=UPI002D30B315|nr:4,5-dihydroxyphthalate decarboxylase [Mycobacterium sp.]HZA12277.1 4,5-dihydroxyphthalate decarboxylase [Mycobacterium sp.]